jgi:Cu/Ag efflux protein CusF
MDVRAFKPALLSLIAAFAAALCCVLPLAVIVLGLGSGAFMATTMRYQRILLPLGILGVSAGYLLYFRERQRCQSLVCTMAGSRVNFVGLGLATAVLLGEVALVAFPEGVSQLFTRAIVSAAKQVEHFEAEGRSVRVEPEKHLLTIDHGDIKGLMSPMTMAFPAASQALMQGIVPGHRVRFTLEQSPQGLSIVALTTEASPGEARVILEVEGMT